MCDTLAYVIMLVLWFIYFSIVVIGTKDYINNDDDFPEEGPSRLFWIMVIFTFSFIFVIFILCIILADKIYKYLLKEDRP